MTTDPSESSTAEVRHTAPATPTEQFFSEVLADVMGSEQVSVESHFFDDLGADSMVMARFCARLRKREDLPPVSIKAVYEHPTIRRLAAAVMVDAPTASTNSTEQLLSEVLADVMGSEQVSVESHFFDDLGADSMVMARFCARLRKQADLPPVSIKEVYEHPTISRLAVALTDAGPSPAAVPESAPVPVPVPSPIGTFQYLLCGALQFLSALGYFYLIAAVSVQIYGWIAAGSGYVDIYGRSVLGGGAMFLGVCIVPILAKWMLIGRWKPQQIRIWSLAYFRFWLVKSLVRLNPLVLFAGSPIYIVYLRALGAKIGRGAVVLSPQVPVCTDLLTIGDNAVVRKDSFFSCYSAHAGVIYTGPVSIGKEAIVGEMTVLDIGSSLGDGAQLGHSSSLHAGQSIPDGEHRCGSPARQQTDVDYREVASAECGSSRKTAYSAFILLNGFVISAFPIIIVILLRSIIADRPHFAMPGFSVFSHWTFYSDALIISSLFFAGSILLGLLYVVTVPRLLNLAIKPGKVYPLYGIHYWVHRTIASVSNARYFKHLIGDSSYIVHYLRAIGYDLSQGVVQTGSNFGMAVKHDNPFLVSIGRGTMIADGLSIVNTDYSNTSFQVARTTIGPDNFLGNAIVYSSQGRTGGNCLLATKVMVPVEGDVRENVGLLGSPSFEIPRTVRRDTEISQAEDGEDQGRKLAAKNKHNLVTMGLLLLSQWFMSFLLILLFFGAAHLYATIGVSVLALTLMLALFLRAGYHVLVERASTLFQSFEPQQRSIYDPYFWYHERFWKLAALPSHLAVFDGTPLKGLAWRLLGVRIGKRVFDDGCGITEKTLVTIGDDCTLNTGSIIQAHSQEDGGFKSDYITIGSGCTLGVNSWVHYGATMGDGAQLEPDTFLMKGEEVPSHARWGDNPANQVQNNYFSEAAMVAVTPPLPTATNTATTGSGG